MPFPRRFWRRFSLGLCATRLESCAKLAAITTTATRDRTATCGSTTYRSRLQTAPDGLAVDSQRPTAQRI